MSEHTSCRGCDQKPNTLDKFTGYCEPCAVKRDEFAKAVLTAMSLPWNYLSGPDDQSASNRAYAMADTMMKRRQLP